MKKCNNEAPFFFIRIFLRLPEILTIPVILEAKLLIQFHRFLYSTLRHSTLVIFGGSEISNFSLNSSVSSNSRQYFPNFLVASASSLKHNKKAGCKGRSSLTSFQSQPFIS